MPSEYREAKSPCLEIVDLHAEVAGREILKGVDLKLRGGEIHAIMGPNGTGKSTLSMVLMGSTKYEVTAGEIRLNDESLNEMPVDERARRGLFLAMQYPAEIEGVSNSDFLRTAINAQRPKEHPMGVLPFRSELQKCLNDLEMDPSLPKRYLNEGFSGGEKKRNEILQMKMLKPSVALLDEIDSGLDIDALRIVGENIAKMHEERGEEMAILMITHYERLLSFVKPSHVHVLMDGRIVKSGGVELVERLEKEGYEWIREEIQNNETSTSKEA
ncbi:MAG: Fe-S cluster assembly ATPase SufC [Eubacteriales bacterium]|nr:Fe-S cluster assembly ATPase SufC [Eubacteriales bacterium]